MAKKYGFSNEETKYDMDFPDDVGYFSADRGPKKGSRQAVTDFGTGFVEGAVGQLTDLHYLKRLTRNNVSGNYGQVMDFADELHRTLSDTLRDAQRDLDPALKDVKRVLRRYEGQIEKTAPKWISSRIKRFAGDPEASGQSAEEMLTAQINAQITSVMGESMAQQAKQSAKEEARADMKEGIEFERFKGMFGQLNSIRIASERSAQYLSDVDFKYKRKSLELQYRSLYYMKDMLEESRKQTAIHTSAYKSLVLNTGLPDYAKLTMKENVKMVLKNKYIGSINLLGLAKRNQFLRDVGKEIRGVVGDRVRNFADSVRGGLQMGEMAADSVSMMQEAGGSATNLAGSFMGADIADRYANKSAAWIRANVNKILPQSVRDRAAKYGNRSAYYLNNLPQLSRQWAQSDQLLPYLGKIPILGELGTGIAQEAIMRATATPSIQMHRSTINNLQTPDQWTYQSTRSLNQIIPGLLARILQSSERLRLGTENVPLVVYDHNKGRWSTHKETREGVMSRVIKDSDRKTLARDVDAIMNHIDPAVDGKHRLSASDRKALRKQIVLDNIRNGGAGSYGGISSGFAERYADVRNLHGMNQHAAERISTHFHNRYANHADPRYVERSEFSRLNKQLGSSTQLDAEYLQNLVNAGHGDILQEMGLMDEKGVIDDGKYMEYLLNGIPKHAMAKAQIATRRKRFTGFSSRRRRGGGAGGLGGGSPVPPVSPTSPYHPSSMGSTPAMNTDSIVHAIHAASSREFVKTIDENIKMIRAQLGVGVRTFGVPLSDVDAAFMDRTLRQHMQNAKGWMGEAKDKFSKWWSEPGVFDKHWKKRGVYKTKIGKVLGGTRDWLTEKWQDMTSIYVEGELTPRLSAWGLRAGIYFDQATGKVVHSWKDIKGTVVDAKGNPILSVEDMKRAFTRSELTKKIIDLGKLLKEKGLEKWNRAKEWTTNTYGKTIRRAKDLYKKAEDYLDAQDVYSKIDMERPKLFAIIMRNGGYRSYHHPDKVIKSPKDIDGPVVNSSGEQVLTDEHIKAGLCDQFGRPIVTGKIRMIQLGKDMLAKLKHNLKMGVQAAKDFMTGKWKGFKDWFQIDGVMVTGGKLIVDRLTEIRNLLYDKFGKPGKRAGNPFDRDGDGLRDGSYEEMKKQGKLNEHVGKSRDWAEKQFNALLDKVPGAKEHAARGHTIVGQLIDKVKTKFLGRFGLSSNRDQDEVLQHMDETLTEIDNKMDNGGGLGGGGLGDGLGGGGSEPHGPPKPGRWQRFKQSAKGRWGRLRQGGVRGAAADAAALAKSKLSRAAITESAAQLAAKAKPGSLVGGAARLGGRGLWGATKLAGRGVWGAARFLAPRALPFLLDASLVTGALEIGGAVLAGIGSVLAAPVVLAGIGVAAVAGAAGYGMYKGYKYLTRQKLTDMSKLRFMQYGFDPKADEKHATAIFEAENMLAPHVSFQNPTPSIDARGLDQKKFVQLFGVDLKDKKSIEKWAAWFSNRFKPIFLVHMAALHATSPKTKLADIEELNATEKLKYLDVAKYPGGPYDVTTNPFDEDPLTVDGKAVGAYAATLIDKLKKEAKKDPLTDKAKVDGHTAEAGVATATAAALATGNKAGKFFGTETSAQKAKYAVLMDQSNKTSQTAVATTGTIMTVAGTFHAGQLDVGTRLDVLTSVRMKTYGLVDMSISKVRTLLQLEMIVQDDISISPKGNAIWKGDPKKVLAACSGAFGIGPTTSGLVAHWYVWFNQRFLPIFLNYYTAMKGNGVSHDLKAAALALKPEQTLQVIDAIRFSRSPDTGQSVWNVKESPWKDYDLNDDVKTVDENIAAIKTSGQVGTIDQVTGLYKDDTDKKKYGTGINGFLNKAVASLGFERKRNLDGSYSMLGLKVNARSDDPNRTSGVQNAVDTSMKGTGGDVSKLSNPKGTSGYDAMKDLITDAANVVGVDPKLMLTIAAIESGFNPSAKAPTSSAKGLYQFIDGTWKMMLKKYGSAYGLGMDASALDPKANALMGAAFLKENVDGLKKFLQRPVTPTDVYISHFLGGDGAKTILTADPSKAAADVLPKAAGPNKSLFFAKDGSKVTVAQFYQEIQNLVQKRSGQYNIGLTGSQTVTADKAGQNKVAADGDKSKVKTVAAPTAAAGLAGVANPAAAAAMASQMPPTALTGAGNAAKPASKPGDGLGDVFMDKDVTKLPIVNGVAQPPPGTTSGSNSGSNYGDFFMDKDVTKLPIVNGVAMPPSLQVKSPKPVQANPATATAFASVATAQHAATLADQSKQQTTAFTQGLDLHQTSNDHLSAIDVSTAKMVVLLASMKDLMSQMVQNQSSNTGGLGGQAATTQAQRAAVTAPDKQINMGKVTFR